MSDMLRLRNLYQRIWTCFIEVQNSFLRKRRFQEKNLKACLKISHMARVYNQVLTEILRSKYSLIIKMYLYTKIIW